MAVAPAGHRARQIGSAGREIALLPCALLVLQALRLAIHQRKRSRIAETSLWALACLTVLLATPHFVTDDLVLVVGPGAIFLTRHRERRIRLALVAHFFLT